MAGSTSIAARIMRNQMHWAGHLIRMDDSRLPKQLFFGELFPYVVRYVKLNSPRCVFRATKETL